MGALAVRQHQCHALAQPALFLQGDRDKLCDLELLAKSLKKYGGRATVEVIPGADHSFHVLKRSGRTEDEVRSEIADAVDTFVRRVVSERR